MPPNIYYQQFLQQLNQQYMQGCSMGQQAGMLEMSGNPPAAAQLYEQAAGLIGNSVVQSRQWNIPVSPDVLFVLATCHFQAARMQAVQGWTQPAAMHLAQALDALNQAIMLSPNVFQLHSAAGTVLAAQGNPAEAARAFERALQLNPADVYSQYMLGALNLSQGNAAAGNDYYQAARQAAPNLPPPQQVVPPPPPDPVPGTQAGPPPGAKTDWLKVMDSVSGLLNAVSGTGNMVHSFCGGMQGQSPPSPGFGNQGPNFNLNNFNPGGF